MTGEYTLKPDLDVRYAFVEFEYITGVHNAIKEYMVEVSGQQAYKYGLSCHSVLKLVTAEQPKEQFLKKTQLLLRIRRANRPQTVMPSSVLSGDSMHLGLLAAAAHAAATNCRFTVFLIIQGKVHQNLLYHLLSMLKLCIIRGFLLACVFGCSLKLKNRAFDAIWVLSLALVTWALPVGPIHTGGLLSSGGTSRQLARYNLGLLSQDETPHILNIPRSPLC